MDAVRLDPNGYDGTYKLVGGRPAFDFVNTISWPDTERRHDWITSPGNVIAWLEAVGLRSEPKLRVDEHDLYAIKRLRAMIRNAVSPLAHGEKPPSAAVEELNACIVDIAVTRRIDPITLTWSWTAPTSAIDMFRPVLHDAADVVVNGIRDRVKHCPSCDWVFEDRTRNGKRRWCDMADCGSRAKSRDYYHRTRTRG